MVKHSYPCAVWKAGCVALFVSVAASAGEERPAGDLTLLSLEQLMNLEVTMVSKREQSLFHSPAAVFVLTRDDLKHSGATNIPEALRLVPGMEVGRIDASKWAVSARGFNAQFANKLLVLIDGRSVYTPLFSGVLWDTQAIPLEEVDRIEVVRGPGGALWGANAVNGIVNIKTRHAAETHGLAFTMGVRRRSRDLGRCAMGAAGAAQLPTAASPSTVAAAIPQTHRGGQPQRRLGSLACRVSRRWWPGEPSVTVDAERGILSGRYRPDDRRGAYRAHGTLHGHLL